MEVGVVWGGGGWAVVRMAVCHIEFKSGACHSLAVAHMTDLSLPIAAKTSKCIMLLLLNGGCCLSVYCLLLLQAVMPGCTP